MRKAWRMPSRHSWRKLRSLPRASGFTFPSSTQTCICLAFWKVFLAQRSGWRPGSVKSAASPEAGLRRRLPEQMDAWGEDPRKRWDADDVAEPSLTFSRLSRHNTCSEALMFAYLFVLIAVAMRLMAGTGDFATYGFTPVGAALLFFGSRMPRKQFWIPVALLIGSDFYLNLKVYGMPITWDPSIVWVWYLAAGFIGGARPPPAQPP